ncbi:MAG: PTS transporter subunit EIIA [bacterium]|nr:PTS transporter subunit EIIA [bacterium]
MKNKKKLSAKDVAALLDIPLVKVQRWVHQGTIPCKFKGSEYFFKRGEIVEWANAHNFSIIEEEQEIEKKKTEEEKTSLHNSIKRGGVFHNLEGDDIFTVLQNAIDAIRFPVEADKDLLLDEIIFRESVASTGIGKGVAIPHLKDVQHLQLPYPIIPVFFLKEAIDFNSIDGKPVFVLFFIFTPAPEIHLKMLSRLSFCLHEQEFTDMLKNGVDEETLLAKIEAIEETIDSD